MSHLVATVLFLQLIDARFGIVEIVFLLTAAGVLLLAPPGFILHWLVLRRLRTRHARTWELLGRPTVVSHGSLSSSVAVLRFFRRREYEGLGDSSLAGICNAYRVYASVYSGVLASTLLAFGLVVIAGH